jgi:hypothetical protein
MIWGFDKMKTKCTQTKEAIADEAVLDCIDCIQKHEALSTWIDKPRMKRIILDAIEKADQIPGAACPSGGKALRFTDLITGMHSAKQLDPQSTVKRPDLDMAVKLLGLPYPNWHQAWHGLVMQKRNL